MEDALASSVLLVRGQVIEKLLLVIGSILVFPREVSHQDSLQVIRLFVIFYHDQDGFSLGVIVQSQLLFFAARETFARGYGCGSFAVQSVKDRLDLRADLKIDEQIKLVFNRDEVRKSFARLVSEPKPPVHGRPVIEVTIV